MRVRRLLVALALSCTAFAAEVPLAPSDPAPSPRTIVAATPRADGFFVVSRFYAGADVHYFGTRISAAGEVLDPGGVHLLTVSTDWFRWDDVRVENGQTVWVQTVGFPEAGNNWQKLDYRIERRTLDVENARITGLQTTTVAEWPGTSNPRNARGETLAVTYNSSSPTLWFVGADGVPRKPTPLTDLGSAVRFVPYGDDEWLILGNRDRGTVWYRISEARRDTPQKMLVDYANYTSSEWKQTVASADGEYAVLTEDVARLHTFNHERNLRLRVIRADGSTHVHALITKELIGYPRWSPLRPTTASLTKDGDAWLVAYSWWEAITGQQQLRIWRVEGSQATETTKLDSYHHPADTGAYDPRMVTGATHNLLLSLKRREHSNFTYDYYVRTWPRGTTPSPSAEPRPFAVSLPPQSAPLVLDRFAVWLEEHRPAAAMLRVGDAPPQRLSSLPYDAYSPVLARNGGTFAAAWVEVHFDQDRDPNFHRVVVRRFDANGAPIGDQDLVLATSNLHPDTYRVAIGADGDGFRVAWHGRSGVMLSAGATPKQTIYTAHIGASGDTVGKIEELALPYILASDPAVVAHGSETLLLWREGQEILGRHYSGGKQVRPGSATIARGPKFSAAAREGEVLIATVRTEQQRVCTEAQRFSFAGVALAPAVEVACTDGFAPQPSPQFVTWDGGRWWIAHARDVHELSPEGAPLAAYRYFADDVTPFQLTLFATGSKPAVVYVRPDASVHMTERAFVRTFPWPRRRAVR